MIEDIFLINIGYLITCFILPFVVSYLVDEKNIYTRCVISSSHKYDMITVHTTCPIVYNEIREIWNLKILNQLVIFIYLNPLSVWFIPNSSWKENICITKANLS